MRNYCLFFSVFSVIDFGHLILFRLLSLECDTKNKFLFFLIVYFGAMSMELKLLKSTNKTKEEEEEDDRVIEVNVLVVLKNIYSRFTSYRFLIASA